MGTGETAVHLSKVWDTLVVERVDRAVALGDTLGIYLRPIQLFALCTRRLLYEHNGQQKIDRCL